MAATGPMDGVVYGYGLDISRCIGCRRCVYACVEENNQSRDPQIHWIRVLEFEREAAIRGIDLEDGEPYYDHETVPAEGKFYLPVACMHCEDSPCTAVCPTGATWQEPDGIVVIDYDWCIGCRYCIASCPYGARHFNWGEPNVPAERDQPRHAPSREPAARARRRREVQLLHPARSRRALSGLPRGLPGGRPQVRKPARSGQRDPIPAEAQADLRAEGRSRDETEVLLLLRVIEAKRASTGKEEIGATMEPVTLFWSFVTGSVRVVSRGTRGYYAWIGLLLLLIAAGLLAYSDQMETA